MVLEKKWCLTVKSTADNQAITNSDTQNTRLNPLAHPIMVTGRYYDHPPKEIRLKNDGYATNKQS